MTEIQRMRKRLTERLFVARHAANPDHDYIAQLIKARDELPKRHVVGSETQRSLWREQKRRRWAHDGGARDRAYRRLQHELSKSTPDPHRVDICRREYRQLADMYRQKPGRKPCSQAAI